jgi:hypothetical protein
MDTKELIDQIEKGPPFVGLSDVRLVETQRQPNIKGIRPDVVLKIDFGGAIFTVYGEVKTQVTPKILEQVGMWLARLKHPGSVDSYALICPYLSPRSQKYCQENGIDFIDLCGNILLRVPGKLLIERLNRPNTFKEKQLLRDPFRGASSRVVRVLLQYPKRKWTITEIDAELKRESERQNRKGLFELSIPSISKTVQSLEQELLVRREKREIVLPDPRQLLFRWAEKYQDRYKQMRRNIRTINNPFGFDVDSSVKGLKSRFSDLDFVVTGTSAADFVAPFTTVDRIDILLLQGKTDDRLRSLENEPSVGPDFVFVEPYDVGVAMYSRDVKGVTLASDIQIYLDCYARGGRDSKQAEYLLSNVIEKAWNKI